MTTVEKTRVNEEYVHAVMTSSCGTSQYFKRAGLKYLVYTDGIYEVQRHLDMYWFVDMVYSHMPEVVMDFKKTNETFYVVHLNVLDDHSAIFTITREEYNYELEEEYEVIVVEQEIPFVDKLPQCQMKFFMELVDEQPTYCMLCPSEH